jgi:hypothetical protein
MTGGTMGAGAESNENLLGDPGNGQTRFRNGGYGRRGCGEPGNAR